MIWRVITVLVSLAVIAAATHANIIHAGGYQSTDAPLIIAVAALLSIGTGFCVITWRGISKLAAVVLAFCLISGEAYWLLTNAEREYEARETAREPLLDAARKYDEARHKAEITKAALTAASTPVAVNARLKAAREGLDKATAAVREQASLAGCRVNCRQLLQAGVDSARKELDAAQFEADAAQAGIRDKAQREADAAQRALEAMPVAHVEERLSERFGLSGWAWDLLLACLRSIAVMGSSIAVGLALHPEKKEEAVMREPRQPKSNLTPATIIEAKIQGKIVERAKPSEAHQLMLVKRDVNSEEHTAAFLRAVLRPDPNGDAPLRLVVKRYNPWCAECSEEPLPPAELGRHVRAMLDAAGLECVDDGGEPVIRGVSLAG